MDREKWLTVTNVTSNGSLVGVLQLENDTGRGAQLILTCPYSEDLSMIAAIRGADQGAEITKTYSYHVPQCGGLQERISVYRIFVALNHSVVNPIGFTRMLARKISNTLVQRNGEKYPECPNPECEMSRVGPGNAPNTWYCYGCSTSF